MLNSCAQPVTRGWVVLFAFVFVFGLVGVLGGVILIGVVLCVVSISRGVFFVGVIPGAIVLTFVPFGSGTFGAGTGMAAGKS